MVRSKLQFTIGESARDMLVEMLGPNVVGHLWSTVGAECAGLRTGIDTVVRVARPASGLFLQVSAHMAFVRGRVKVSSFTMRTNED